MVNQSQPNMEELSCDDSGSMAASSTTGVENSAGSAKSILQEQITRQETKVVFQLRLFVVLVLLAAGCKSPVVLQDNRRYDISVSLKNPNKRCI